MADVHAVAAPSLWEPLRTVAFRALWSAQLVANVATWMHTASAQWVLTSGGASATAIAAVQTAVTLPFFLLALPAGVLADAVDRRRVMLIMQLSVAVVSAVLAAITASGRAGSAGILIATFLMGSASAVSIIAWQSLIPDLVERPVIPSAATVDGISFNAGRIIGPAVGGLLLSVLDAEWIFGIDAIVFTLAGLAFWRWAPAAVVRGTSETMVSALRAGLRYVRYSPLIRRLLLRVLLWTLPASVIWALLPVVAHDRLHLAAGGFGALFSALGIGAVLGGVCLAPLRRRTSPNTTLMASSVSYAIALVVVATASAIPVVVGALIIAGAGWIAALSTMMAQAHASLPPWVRARGLATVLLVHQGCQAFGSLLWGLAGDAVGVRPALIIAAISLAAAGLSITRIGLRPTDAVDPVQVSVWTEPRAAALVDPGRGPILVLVEYEVRPEVAEAFRAAVEQLGRSRQRIGARRWEVYSEGERPDRVTEAFVVSSWGDHVHQESVRWTRADKRIRDAAETFAEGSPVVRRLVAIEHSQSMPVEFDDEERTP